MRAPIRRSRLICLPILAVCMFDAVADAPARLQEQWGFTVYLDGKPIGNHSFNRTEKGGEIHVNIRAQFQVRILFVPVYRYEHENREVWRDGCLMRIDARTSDNGDLFFVRGALRNNVFSIETARGGERLPECISTFAYWDRAFLSADKLLNAQTGEYVPVAITPARRELLRVGNRQVAAERHAVRTADFSIDLWYSPEGEWLALESKTKEGRTLRYEKQQT